MLHDRRQRYWKRPGKLTDRNAVAELELREQGAPRGIGKRGESAVQRDTVILNHVVKFRMNCQACQCGCRRTAMAFAWSRLEKSPISTTVSRFGGEHSC